MRYLWHLSWPTSYRVLRLFASSIGILVAATFVAACGGSVEVGSANKSVDTKSFEKDVASTLIKQVGAEKGSATVDCPGKRVEFVKNDKHTCVLTDIATGKTYETVVTMSDDAGAFDVKVAAHPLEDPAQPKADTKDFETP